MANIRHRTCRGDSDRMVAGTLSGGFGRSLLLASTFGHTRLVLWSVLGVAVCACAISRLPINVVSRLQCASLFFFSFFPNAFRLDLFPEILSWYFCGAFTFPSHSPAIRPSHTTRMSSSRMIACTMTHTPTCNIALALYPGLSGPFKSSLHHGKGFRCQA